MPKAKHMAPGLAWVALLACADGRSSDRPASGADGSAPEQPGSQADAAPEVDAANADAANTDAANTDAASSDAQPSDAGLVADASDAETDAAGIGPRVWSDTSVSLEIEWTALRIGSYRFEAERDRLSAEQLRLLRALEIVPGGGAGCPDATTSVWIIVTDETGAVQRYLAFDCESPTSPTAYPLVDYGGVAPLLATLGCLSIDSSSEQDLTSAPHIGLGDGCLHGLHKPSGQPAEWWVLVDVDAPGRYRFRLDYCISRRLRLEVTAASGSPVLAEMEGTSSVCPLVEHELDAAGTYALHVVQPGGATPGDYYLIAEPIR